MTKETFLKKLGKNVTRIREEQGFSQSQLAKELLKDRQSIHRLEKGGINMSIYTLQQIAEILKVPVSKLLDFDSANSQK